MGYDQPLESCLCSRRDKHCRHSVCAMADSDSITGAVMAPLSLQTLEPVSIFITSVLSSFLVLTTLYPASDPESRRDYAGMSRTGSLWRSTRPRANCARSPGVKPRSRRQQTQRPCLCHWRALAKASGTSRHTLSCERGPSGWPVCGHAVAGLRLQAGARPAGHSALSLCCNLRVWGTGSLGVNLRTSGWRVLPLLLLLHQLFMNLVATGVLVLMPPRGDCPPVQLVLYHSCTSCTPAHLVELVCSSLGSCFVTCCNFGPTILHDSLLHHRNGRLPVSVDGRDERVL